MGALEHHQDDHAVNCANLSFTTRMPSLITAISASIASSVIVLGSIVLMGCFQAYSVGATTARFLFVSRGCSSSSLTSGDFRFFGLALVSGVVSSTSIESDVDGKITSGTGDGAAGTSGTGATGAAVVLLGAGGITLGKDCLRGAGGAGSVVVVAAESSGAAELEDSEAEFCCRFPAVGCCVADDETSVGWLVVVAEVAFAEAAALAAAAI